MPIGIDIVILGDGFIETIGSSKQIRWETNETIITDYLILPPYLRYKNREDIYLGEDL